MDYFDLLQKGTTIKKEEQDESLVTKFTDQNESFTKSNSGMSSRLNFFNVEEFNSILEKKKPLLNGQDDQTLNKENKISLNSALNRSLFYSSKNNKVKIKGVDLPKPIEKFADLKKYKYKKRLLKNIKSEKLVEPTLVQKYTIPVLESRRDAIIRAPTGSGKTLSFLLPVLNLIFSAPKSEKLLQAIILSPTKELCYQLSDICKKFSSGKKIKIKSLCKFSRSQIDTFLVENLSKNVQLLISTPFKLCAAVKMGLSLNNLKYLILDEGDKLLSKNFLEQITVIVKELSSNACKCLFSATISPYVEELSQYFLNKTVHVSIGKNNAASSMSNHKLVFVGSEEGKLLEVKKMALLGFDIPAIIFTHSIQRANNLFRDLVYENINVGLLHADRTKTQREKTIKSFKEGKIWVLITSELISRGIDFKNVNLVINYDFPQSIESYLHRAGRTGRGGKQGNVITFFTKDDYPFVKSIAAAIKASGATCMEWISNIPKLTKSKKRKLRSKTTTHIKRECKL